MSPADDQDNNQDSEPASSPCSLRAADPVYAGLANDPEAVYRWRKQERERLISERLSIPVEERLKMGRAVARNLERAMGDVRGLTVSAYWPFRGETDLRPLMGKVAARGARTALPVCIKRAAPMIFRAWTQGDPLERGVWNIPVPTETADIVIPDIVISPVVGFDSANYRLGYGGGYFDRTLADLSVKPLVIGVGYACAKMPTICPQPHDIPMDMIVTEGEA